MRRDAEEREDLVEDPVPPDAERLRGEDEDLRSKNPGAAVAAPHGLDAGETFEPPKRAAYASTSASWHQRRAMPPEPSCRLARDQAWKAAPVGR